MKLLLKNIKNLLQVREESKNPVKGADMKLLPGIENAWLAVEDGYIIDYGEMTDFPGIEDWRDLEIIDAENKIVLPAWVDAHSHIVYAGNREEEFVDRINGLSYEEIALRGGGILNSAEKLANTSEEELIVSALERIKEISFLGTGALEIKSGYGLSLQAELKMLRVIKKIKEQTPLTIKSTFLGAHAIPKEFKNQKENYIKLILEEMIPAIQSENLADFIDVFCEKNYFNPEETEQILEAGKKAGMIPKVHAEQLSNYGGVLTGVKCSAISVDHLEFVEAKEINALLNSTTIPVILPGAAFFLNLPHPPVRKMIDAGLPIALASDFNPGSSPSGNMNLMQAIACIQYKITPNEAINASTLNSAFAMNVEKELGSITRGKKANLIVTKNIPSSNFIPYSFGSNPVEKMILNGKIIH